MTVLAGPGFYPFTIAALILIGLVVVEIVAMVVGMSISSLFHGGLSHHGSDGPLDAWMSWLNTGGVPLLILMMIWLAAFAIAGFAIQGVSQAFFAPLPASVASIAALVMTVPITRGLSRWTARIFPGDETAAINQTEFIGLTGTVVLGPLDQGKPGQVRVKDRHGNIHVLRATAALGHTIPQGAPVLVVDGVNGVFETIPAPKELGAPTDIEARSTH